VDTQIKEAATTPSRTKMRSSINGKWNLSSPTMATVSASSRGWFPS
jgi:hypothetical protein